MSALQDAASATLNGTRMVKAVLDEDEPFLLQHKEWSNTLSEDGELPLYAACKRGVAISIVNLLLKLGAKTDAKGTDRETPLYIACFNNNLEHAKVLLSSGGANVNEVNGSDNETALHVVSKFGYIDLLLYLVKSGANVNARTSRMETPMFAAAKNGKHESIYYLLMHNANSNLANEDGKSPLYVASEKRFKHCVIVLKAELKYLKEAKSEADTELKMRRPSLATTDEIEQRFLREKSAVSTAAQSATPSSTQSSPQPAMPSPSPSVLKKTPTPPPPVVLEKMEIIPIEIPKLVIRDHNPITGEKYGPCRTLEEVGYDEPPAIPDGMVLPPVEPVRVGGTMLMVGTGTEQTAVAPKIISILPDDDTVDYLVPPRTKK
mmetsp:Transcript_6268/g.6983  ORF Transcript_6268/g.6983 Transcript_6268/m.6983 type:complete len:377 (-) Transcript_6268:250-1380(-)|eukprot:CAMPEP_0176439798 /NCGR_PEP_ID=MMETSP0127-20121128/20174_1 /TAXON_ID=938130 /ORGANISM="Platyophrya macrostoma, Strain WH" /LENGTH=376 /DNA_ID=CAMNT_0017824169 /DNA_START=135 /DNA_END=1265 /DNA_ORIENTATION=+